MPSEHILQFLLPIFGSFQNVRQTISTEHIKAPVMKNHYECFSILSFITALFQVSFRLDFRMSTTLARRPGHIAAAEHVEMHVGHTLARLRADVGHHAVAIQMQLESTPRSPGKMCPTAAQFSSVTAETEEICALGITRNAPVPADQCHKSIAYIILIHLIDGISPAMILQNKQSPLRIPSFSKIKVFQHFIYCHLN